MDVPQEPSTVFDMFSKLLDHGVAVLIVILLLWALYREGKWIAEEILKPVRNKAFDHLDATSTALKNLCATMDCLKDEIGQRHAEVGKQLADLHSDVKQIKMRLELPKE